jgi:hypothetical protein
MHRRVSKSDIGPEIFYILALFEVISGNKFMPHRFELERINIVEKGGVQNANNIFAIILN